jgi:hypothetical protein
MDVRVLLSTPDPVELSAAKLALEDNRIQSEVLNDGIIRICRAHLLIIALRPG